VFGEESDDDEEDGNKDEANCILGPQKLFCAL
jgi:hypothetical protein